MMFDGKKLAGEVISSLPRAGGVKLVMFLGPENKAGARYVELKRRMAQRLGVEFEVLSFKSGADELKAKIRGLNNDPKVGGIVIQLPFPGAGELIESIDPEKDVDGLREDSPFRPAVVRAVMEILRRELGIAGKERVVVVGSRGFVGRRLVRELRCEGVDKEDFDPEKIREADVVISCTGRAGLVTGEMVKDNFAAIDVGYPEEEFAPDALAKAGFWTPVPGGVGPVTVACLFANLLEATAKKKGA